MSSFVREAGTAVFLVMFTLYLQCAGMAAQISFASPFRSAHGAIDDEPVPTI